MRSSRRRELIRILREGRASSQEEIARALRAAGHDVTQATISRDLRELGAVKVRRDGRPVYRLPDEVAGGWQGALEAALDEFALDVRPAGTLVVVLTPPGHAHALARAMDVAGVPDVVGTVAGDDTIFVATPDERAARRLAARWGRRAQEVS